MSGEKKGDYLPPQITIEEYHRAFEKVRNLKSDIAFYLNQRGLSEEEKELAVKEMKEELKKAEAIVAEGEKIHGKIELSESSPWDEPEDRDATR